MTDILLVTIDSLRADHLSAYGYDRRTSPTLNRLAADGHLFERAFAHAGATRSSFPSILTSSYPPMYGGFERLSSERILLSEILDQAGYRTAGFHSNPYLSEPFGYGRGFDRFSDWRADPSVTARLRQLVKDSIDRDGLLYQVVKGAFRKAEQSTGIEFGSLYQPADDLTDYAIDWLESARGDDRFLWVHYMDVHNPYVPPAEDQRAIAGAVVSDRRAMKLRRKMMDAPEDVTEAERETLIDLYDAEIRFADAEIGRLIARARSAWGEDVAVFVTADHGEEFAEHGRYSHHGTFYEEMIHVPLIIDVEGAGQYDDLVGLVDLAPTIVDFAGVEPPEEYRGDSLRELIESGSWDRKSVVSAVDDKRYYRDDRWKYIRYGDSVEVYDLSADPTETDNLVGQHPEVESTARAAIEALESEIESTATEIEGVEMDEDVRERLRNLGYQE
jgi:arylsulfatase A-like enzyme